MMKYMLFLVFAAAGFSGSAQNLVPNPGFEMHTNCAGNLPLVFCLDEWKDFSSPNNPVLNTPDVKTTGTFFTSISAYEGSYFAGISCSESNPEYLQVRLSEPMIAGGHYCVSFYLSMYNAFNLPSAMGVHFSAVPLMINPYAAGISAHVQSDGMADPEGWKPVSGSYTAAGGEQYMTLGGFENHTGGLFSYMYVDAVEVHLFAPQLDLGPDGVLCSDDELVLDAGEGATKIRWSTGETTSSITVKGPGTYSVEKFYGACAVSDEIVLAPEGCALPEVPPATIFVPDAFTPGADGINDYFGARATQIGNYRMAICNRWGELIFTSADLAEQWDGTYLGEEAAPGIYAYLITYTDAGRDVQLRGHVCLIR